MNEAERKNKITVEDLLQLKRAERPPVEFWSRFEQELRTKQLAALVKPVRPWWHSLVGRKALVRVYAPLGAAAVVALSFGIYQRPGVQVAAVNLEPAAATHVAANETPAMPAPIAQTAQPQIALAPVTEISGDSHEAVRENLPKSVAIAKSDSAPAPEQLVVAGAATVKAAGQALAQLVGLSDENALKNEAPSATAVEPLAQLSSPRDNRRARLLAYTVAYDPHAAGSRDSVRSRDRIARGISDESIYDSISRLGVSGDRVSIKF